MKLRNKDADDTLTENGVCEGKSRQIYVRNALIRYLMKKSWQFRVKMKCDNIQVAESLYNYTKDYTMHQQFWDLAL